MYQRLMRTSVRVRQRRRPVIMREMDTIMKVVVVVISLALFTSTSANNTGMTQKNVVKFYATEVVVKGDLSLETISSF